MENNVPQQPGVPTPAAAPLPQQPQPAAPTFQPVVQEEHKSGMKMIIMLFVIIVLVIAILAGGYWFMSNQVKQTTYTQPKPNPQQQSQKEINQINSDLGTVSALDSEDNAFTSVDADTEKL